MKRRLCTRFICAFILTSIIAAEMPLVVFASLTNDLIEQSEASKKQAEENKSALKNGLSDIKAMLSSLESAKDNLEEYITELDADLEIINQNKANIEQQIADKEAEIELTEVAIEEAQKVVDTQYAAMKIRIKHMYEKGSTSYVQMMIESKSLAELLNKVDYIQKLSKYDRNMLESYMESKRVVEETKEKLVAQQEELLQAKADLENEEDAMETLISAKEEEIGVYDADIDNKEAAVAAYQAEIAAQDAIIKELEAAILAEKKRLIEENKKAIIYDGGQFSWPAPSYTRISDDYGNRIHPTLGVQQFHNGVDMAAPGGSPILAAYDGEVVAASYSSSMGNYIMIDHGDGLVTVYMHASSLGVSQGQTVVKGQQIGCVGSTGRSTGNHLHFSVRLNGSYVSPWNYLG